MCAPCAQRDLPWLALLLTALVPFATSGSQHKKKLKLFCGWFCPFAQRAWIACEEKRLDYQYIEVNPSQKSISAFGGYSKRALPLEEKRKRYPQFLAISPRGLVPALDADGEWVWDSLQLCEYLDERFSGSGSPLLPGSALARARAHLHRARGGHNPEAVLHDADGTSSRCAREGARLAMIDGCRQLARAMASGGPFFLGPEFSLFEVAMAPFWQVAPPVPLPAARVGFACACSRPSESLPL